MQRVRRTLNALLLDLSTNIKVLPMKVGTSLHLLRHELITKKRCILSELCVKQVAVALKFIFH